MSAPHKSRITSPSEQSDELVESLHALPGWFAWFQKTFGLSFLVIASAYLLGNLATLGWVPDISRPETWGWFKGAGVVLFFVGGVAVAGIGLTCSVVFVASIKRRSWFLVVITGVGMLLFFGVEVWASLSERSLNILPTPADKAVLVAFGFHGVPPISPTALVVSVLFPLGSLYFGFVQQRRVAVTSRDLEEDALEMERKVRQAEQDARLAEALAHKRAVQARGAVGVVRAATEAVRSPQHVPLSPNALTARDSASADTFSDPVEPPYATLGPLATSRSSRHSNGSNNHHGYTSPEDDARDDDPPF